MALHRMAARPPNVLQQISLVAPFNRVNLPLIGLPVNLAGKFISSFDMILESGIKALMDFYRMKYFVAVADYGSFSAAAQNIHISQPSLSTQIKLLESELDCHLLERTPRGIRMTAAGKRFYQEAKRILAELHDLSDSIKKKQYQAPRQLKVGIQPIFASSLLAPVLKKFWNQYRLQVIVKERRISALPDLLYRRQVDLCILTVPAELPSWACCSTLSNFHYAAYYSKQFLPRPKKRISLKNLISHPIFVYQDPADLEHRIQAIAQKSGRKASVLFSSEQALTVLEMVKTSAGIGLLPDFLAKTAGSKNILCKRLHSPCIQGRLGILARQDWIPDPHEQEFINSLKAILQRTSLS